MDKEQFDNLLTDVNARLDAIDERFSEEALKELVATSLPALMESDEDFARKMRFAAGGAPKALVGSKFARWNLSVGDVEFLYDLMIANKTAGRGKGPSEELTNTFEAISSAFYLPEEQVRAMDREAIDDLFPRIPLSEFHGTDRDLASEGKFELTGAYKRAIRAMDTAESGYGAELIGAQYVGELWEAARQESRIFNLLESFEMTAPTAYLPVEADLPEMLYVSEFAAVPDGSYYTSVKTGSNRVQVDAKKFLIYQVWSGEMAEDSIVPFVPFIRRQQTPSLAHYLDSVTINGDTTNTATGNINLDDADPADTKHYLAFDGIRHVGLVDNTANQDDIAAALVVADLTKAKARMIDAANLMDWGHPTDPNDLVYVGDPESIEQIRALSDFVLWFQYRGQPLLTGQVTQAAGHPVISSIAVSKTEADGKVSTTGGNNVKGQVVVFNRRGFKTGWRRRVKIEMERIAARDQDLIVSSLRLGFGRYSPSGAASGIEAADVLFDITV